MLESDQVPGEESVELDPITRKILAEKRVRYWQDALRGDDYCCQDRREALHQLNLANQEFHSY